MLLLVLGQLAHAACDAPVASTLLSQEVAQAQEAVAALNADGFVAATERAQRVLPCLSERLSALEAADYHGLMALSAFANGRRDEAVRAFAAALASSPIYDLPDAIAPKDGPLDRVIGDARTLAPVEPSALPAYDGVLYVDGRKAVLRPGNRPCLLQLVRSDGTIEGTYYLRATDPLPVWISPRTGLQRLVPEARHPPSLPLGVAAGSTALLAGGLYALGGVWHAKYQDPDTPYAELGGLQARTNAALGGSIALGATAVVFTSLTFFEW